ncbi:MAG: hypothetical protein KAY32_15575 [Candidatus Eisenbacteria sp.]|nr:hypothetical protein [Candidatus Eisenbacteria bacterium]
MASDKGTEDAKRFARWKRTSYVVLLALLALTLLWSKAFIALRIAEVSAETIMSLIGSLLVVTALLERSLEVFINATRKHGRARCDLAMKAAKARLKEATTPEEKKGPQASLETAQETLTAYKSDTGRIAALWGMVGGVLISLAGIRVLHSLLAPNVIIENSTQYMLFSVVDVFVTGLLLAGGSDGLHQVAALLTGYFEKKKEAVQDS